MIALTDSQIAAITYATRPLQPSERTEFLAALFDQLLSSRDQIGDGSLGRLIRDLQRIRNIARWLRPRGQRSGYGSAL